MIILSKRRFKGNMFTGIIEETGIIKSIKQNSSGMDIEIIANQILNDIKIGDSVAINGCCQTVTNISSKIFTVQAVFETLKLTNFDKLAVNKKVNLERALTLNSRLGGHIVTGHIDGTGKLTSKTKLGNSTIFEFETTPEISKYMIYKGSITINGVSLTICELNKNKFKVSIIPHTINNTTFCELKIGDIVNLEPDILAKYIEKLMIKEDNTNSKITLKFLKENGF